MSMTLEQVRDWLIKEGQFRIRVQGKNEHDNNLLKMADAIDAHIPQPAQSVDVRDVVLKSLGGYLERHWPDNPVSYDDMADKLTAALQEKGK